MNDPSPRGGTEWHRRVEMPPDKKNFDFWKIIFISHSLFQAILNFNILISRISRYYNVPMFWKFWDSPKCVISIYIPALQIQNSPRCGRHARSIWLTYQYKGRRQDEEVNGLTRRSNTIAANAVHCQIVSSERSSCSYDALIILEKNDFAYGNQSFWEYFSEFSGVFFRVFWSIFLNLRGVFFWMLSIFPNYQHYCYYGHTSATMGILLLHTSAACS